MFESFKDRFYSVVQDGINLNSAVRKKISDRKTVSPGSDERCPDLYAEKVNYGAGGELLAKYQREWTELHENAEINAKKAEKVDIIMAHISGYNKLQLSHLTSMNALLAALPSTLRCVEACAEQLQGLGGKLRALEKDLLTLEAAVETADYQRRCTEHFFQLTMYKERKLAALEQSRVRLAAQQATAAKETEQRQRGQLQQRQLAAQAAFQADLQRFKAQGALPSATTKDSAAVTTTPASLEEIQLDVEDTQDLDDFLNT